MKLKDNTTLLLCGTKMNPSIKQLSQETKGIYLNLIGYIQIPNGTMEKKKINHTQHSLK